MALLGVRWYSSVVTEGDCHWPGGVLLDERGPGQ